MEDLRDIGDVPPIDIWDGVVARTIEGERITMALVDLRPNAAVPEHTHENEQVGIMLQGSGTFRVGEETMDVGPGSTWRILSNVPHSLDVGPEGAVVIDIFAPLRLDWRRFEPGEASGSTWHALEARPGSRAP
jgi:quercetin dioxygenase-like cupin family protein